MSKSSFSTHLVVGSLAVIVLFILAPNLVSAYRLELLTIFLINVILAQSYRLMATTGDWTLCHYILMGVGAYATGILAKMAGLPFYLVMPLACFITVFVSMLFAIPLSRTLGFAFFIASFALGASGARLPVFWRLRAAGNAKRKTSPRGAK